MGTFRAGTFGCEMIDFQKFNVDRMVWCSETLAFDDVAWTKTLTNPSELS